MDVKVYKKEEVLQPSGTEYVYVPDVIDLIPRVTKGSNGNEVLSGAEELDDDSRDLLEQEVTLSTIKQRGLDPLDKEDGIQWSEALLGEINVVQLMSEIVEAVTNTTTSVTVVFDTVTDDNGRSYLSYKLQGVA